MRRTTVFGLRTSARIRNRLASGRSPQSVVRSPTFVFLLALVGCGPKAVFTLTSANDNDRAALTSALALRQLPDKPTPTNAARQPRVFVVEAGKPKTIVAFDLSTDKQLWKTAADVESRIWVGGDFVVALEAKQLVARDQQTGAARWKSAVPGVFVGAAADRDRAYVVYREGDNEHPVWNLVALDGASGKELWKAPAEGQLGAPAAQGGIVYSPYLTQWLSLLDGKSGKPLARVRGLDEQISMVRATSRDAYFGSNKGVFVLDARAAAGKREGATYGTAKIPAQLDRTSYGRDMYDAVQSGYTAADRARLLFSAEPAGDGPLKFSNDSYAIHYFRFVFGFSAAGDLVWAFSNPRVELVASDHTGGAIVGVSQSGDLVALDPKTGAVRLQKKLGTTGLVLGATFDADGWAPTSANAPVETVAALVSIARDHDARFDKVKELAVSSLARLPGPEVTKELLAVLADNRAPQRLKDAVAELLVKRKDPGGLPVLTAQLATHADYIAKTQPESLGPVARAISGLAGVKLEPDKVSAALAGLEFHLNAPTTQSGEIALVIDAMAAIGGGAERRALGSHLLLYHADDELGGDPVWDKAIVDALVVHGGPGERELLRWVAKDPRTRPSLATAIRDATASD